MNARAALQNGARASAIKPNNKGHSKNSRAEAGKGTYTQFEPARTHTQLYNLKPTNANGGLLSHTHTATTALASHVASNGPVSISHLDD